MAQRFSVDPEQAQEVAGKLLSVGGAISNLERPGPQQQNLGTGLVEEALSEFTTRVSTAHQNLAQSIDKGATNFHALSTGSVELDQQEAQEVVG
ncbi:MAG TPA: hypothetical protein VGL21_02755 [Jatrophihabitantaceae bacterium]